MRSVFLFLCDSELRLEWVGHLSRDPSAAGESAGLRDDGFSVELKAALSFSVGGTAEGVPFPSL